MGEVTELRSSGKQITTKTRGRTYNAFTRNAFTLKKHPKKYT